MKTKVSILHHDYPSRYRNLVEERLAALERFNQEIISMDARLEKDARSHRVELVANLRSNARGPRPPRRLRGGALRGD